jgi:signal transduction histidine kinase
MVEIDEKFIVDATEIAGNKLFEEGKISNWDSYYLRKDGKTVPVESNIAYLYNDEGETIGAIGVSRDITERRQIERALRESHQELEEKVEERTADLKVINERLKNEIIERKRAEEKLIEYQNQLRSMASQLTLTEEKERRHFADYLHDQIGQKLFALNLQLETLRNSTSADTTAAVLDESFNIVKQMINDTRSLTFEISPPLLYQLGLEAALEWITEETHKQYGIMVTFEDDKQEKPMDDDTKILIFRAVRELLTNIAKHAQTQKAKVSIGRDNTNIRVCVEDDGVGFIPSETILGKSKSTGFGLFSIKERLEQLGGNLEIESILGRGTQITLVAPLKSKKSQE